MASDTETLRDLQTELRRASECLASGDPAGMLEALHKSAVLDGLTFRLKRTVSDLQPSVIADILADVIGELYEETRKGAQVRNLGGWIWKVASRNAIEAAELERCRSEVTEETEQPEVDGRAGEEPQAGFVKELRSAVRELPAGRVRDAISHVAEQAIDGRGWTYEDLSAALGVTIPNARTIIQRGRWRLRRILEGRGLMRAAPPDEIHDAE